MSRLGPITREQCTPEQAELFDAITGGDRARHRTGVPALVAEDGALIGPFNALLRLPAIGHLAQQMGSVLRFHGNLSGREREIAILVIAASWRARYEWWAHARIAASEGLAQVAIDAIARGDSPDLDDPREAMVHALSTELIETRRVSDGLYARATESLGEEGVYEVIALLGYYTLVGMTLNTFDVQLPDGEATPFD